MEVELEPHTDRVFVDYCAEKAQWRLTHTTTQESVPLDHGDWVLAWDSDGFAYLSNQALADINEQDVDEIFQWTLAKTVEGSRLVCLGPASEDKGVRPQVYMDHAPLVFEERIFTFRMGPTSQAHHFDFAQFQRRRQGFVCFWSLSSLYQSLGFTMFSNTPSRWAWQSLPRIEKTVSQLAVGQVLRSQCYEDRPEVSLEDRCLPFHSMSTVGLIHMLCQWSMCSTRHGGLKLQQHREACDWLLHAIAKEVCERKTHRVPILVDDDFEWRWPRPAAGDHPFVLTIQDSVVDTESLYKYCVASMDNLPPWEGDLGDIKNMGVGALMMNLMGRHCLTSLFRQLALWLAAELEKLIVGADRTPAPQARTGVTAKPASHTIWQISSRLVGHLNRTNNYVMDQGRITHMSIATDKSSVGGLPIQNSFVQVNGTAVVFPAMAQVDKDYDGIVTEARENSGVKRKAEVLEAVGAAKTAMRARQQAWLTRARQRANTWRPKPVPRRAAYRWLQCVDNVIRLHTGVEGLSHFVGPTLEDLREDKFNEPLKLPQLSLCMDRGSDGVAALHFLERVLRVNCEPQFDQSHDSWRDFLRMLRELGLTPFWYVYLITASMLHGPFLECSRFNSLREAMVECWGEFTAESNALFGDSAKDILKEAGTYSTAEQEVKRVFAAMPDSEIYHRRGYKVNMNRFWHGVERGWVVSRNWTKLKVSFVFMALETGALQGSGMSKIFFKNRPDNNNTGAEAASMEERALKGRVNALTASVVFLSESSGRNKLRAILTVAKPVEAWYRYQAHFCRSIENNYQWMSSQLEGEYMKHIESVFHRLLTCSDLEFVGFWVEESSEPAPTGDALDEERNLAVVFGDLVLAMVSARSVRSIYLLAGWPSQALLFLSGDEEKANDAVNRLRHDYLNFLRLEKLAADGNATAQMMMDRSPFATVAVAQLVMALKKSPTGEWRLSPAFLSWLKKKYLRQVGSLICEDAFNAQKNANLVKGKRKYMRPQKATDIIIESKVASKCHKYGEVQGPSVAASRAQHLKRDAFQCDPKKASLKFKKIKTGGQSPPWYSKAADLHPQPYADLSMVSQAWHGGRFKEGVIRNAWLGDLVNYKHHIALQNVGGHSWAIGLKHISESSCVVWPVCLRTAPNSTKQYFVPIMLQARPTLVTVSDLSEWQCASFVAVPPSAQDHDLPESRGRWAMSGVRFMKSSDTMPLKEMAARCAFWELGKTFLMRFGDHIGMDIREGCSLVDLVWGLCEKCLPDLNEDQVQRCVEQRLVIMTRSFERADGEQYGEVDELHTVLEQRDEKAVQDEVKGHEDRKIVLEQAKTDFVTRVASRSGASSKLGKILNSEGKRYPKNVPEGEIAHSTAKGMTPPTAKVWRHTKEGRWCGVQPPYSEVSRSWARYGERESLMLVLRKLWEQFLTSKGLTTKSCPIAGLFA